jgi:LCP family protein required for cell wall assembly
MASRNTRWIWLILAVLLIAVLILLSVNWLARSPANSSGEADLLTLTPTLTARPGQTRSWPGPIETPATPVPDPLQGISLHDEVESIVLLGLDQDFPFTGRTDAMYLILYNRRTSKASVISIPPDLFVYIPGYTMQRINSAYPVGGIEQVSDTLEYNLGINPDHYLLVQFSDFPRLIDAIGGVEVVVIDDLTDPCQLKPGDTHMNGAQAFCFAIHRSGENDIERNRRQLQVMRAFFLRLVVDGQIARLPVLHAEFQESVQSDLTLGDLLANIPLAIMLADPERVAYFQISWDEVTQWLMPGRAKTIVLLPNQAAISELVSAAIDFVMTPAPLSDLAITLQAQLTQQVLITFTPTLPFVTSTTTNTPGIPTITATVTPTPTEGAYPPPLTPTAPPYP